MVLELINDVLTYGNDSAVQAIAWGPILTGLVGAGVNLYSSWKGGQDSASANDAAQKQIADAQAKNEAWWQQKQNENYLDSADAQAALAKAKEMAAEQLQYARGRQAVMGGTGADYARAQQSANKMLSDTMSGLAQAGAARKDAAEQTYMAQSNALTQQLMDMYKNRAASSAAAGSGALQSLGQIGSALITAFGGSAK